VTSPGATLFAQKFLPTEVRDLRLYLAHHLTRPKLWVPFFNIVSLSIGVRISPSIQHKLTLPSDILQRQGQEDADGCGSQSQEARDKG
jgi:hypothetical protein